MSPGSTELPFEILVVDDEAFVRETLTLYLESEGCVVHTAANGHEALDLLESHPVEAAVVDIRMPGMDGLTLLSELKMRAPDVEVLMSTGFQSLETAVEAMRRGACNYITKPITDLESDLFRFVVRAIERRRLRLRNRALSHDLQRALDELGGVRGEWQRHVAALDTLNEFGRRSLASRTIEDLLAATEVLLPRLVSFASACVQFGGDGTPAIVCTIGDASVAPPTPPASRLDDRVRQVETPGDKRGSPGTLWFPLPFGDVVAGWLSITPHSGKLVDADRAVLRTLADQLSLSIASLHGPSRPDAEPTY